MTRALIRSPTFLRALKKLFKKQPGCVPAVEAALKLLAADAFDPRLGTHKLSAELAGTWACSAGYDLRILFSFAQHKGAEVLVLETIGTHDQVY